MTDSRWLEREKVLRCLRHYDTGVAEMMIGLINDGEFDADSPDHIPDVAKKVEGATGFDALAELEAWLYNCEWKRTWGGYSRYRTREIYAKIAELRERASEQKHVVRIGDEDVEFTLDELKAAAVDLAATQKGPAGRSESHGALHGKDVMMDDQSTDSTQRRRGAEAQGLPDLDRGEVFGELDRVIDLADEYRRENPDDLKNEHEYFAFLYIRRALDNPRFNADPPDHSPDAGKKVSQFDALGELEAVIEAENSLIDMTSAVVRDDRWFVRTSVLEAKIAELREREAETNWTGDGRIMTCLEEAESERDDLKKQLADTQAAVETARKQFNGPNLSYAVGYLVPWFDNLFPADNDPTPSDSEPQREGM
jgi:hypothetical protein